MKYISPFSNSALLLMSIALFTFGCKRDRHARGVETLSTRLYTTSELNRMVIPGMSIADVTNKVGIPQSTIRMSAGSEMLVYNFPFSVTSRESGRHMVGFDIHTRDGHVLGWSPTIGESRESFVTGGTQQDLGMKQLEFFAMAGALTNVLNTFLANGVANVTGLNVSPEVDIKAKVVLEKRDASNGVFIIMVAEPDISRLKRLSIDNIGRHVLIVCHQEVVAAPVILGLMASPQLVVTVKHVASVEKVLRD